MADTLYRFSRVAYLAVAKESALRYEPDAHPAAVSGRSSTGIMPIATAYLGCRPVSAQFLRHLAKPSRLLPDLRGRSTAGTPPPSILVFKLPHRAGRLGSGM